MTFFPVLFGKLRLDAVILVSSFLLITACGVGTTTAPKNQPPRNLNYQLTLNDTGVTKYLNGATTPSLTGGNTLSTTVYSYYATE